MTAKEIEVRLDDSAKSNCQVDPELPALFFCRDLIGYGWCFRKGDHLNIGLGRLVPQGLAEHLAQFHTILVSREIIPPATPTHYHGHAYLLRSVSDRDPVADGVLLVGDAAGLAYPESGEGIRPAIESALLAAQIVTTTAGGRDGRDDLEPYCRVLESRFGPSGERQPGFTGKPSWLHAGIGGFLLGIPWFARRVVMENWFLHAHQRPLQSRHGARRGVWRLYAPPTSPPGRSDRPRESHP